jgi:kynurenine 3-monooxygenase
MVATRRRKALIVGAGPVGALTALSLHRRGWEVEIWESRDGSFPDLISSIQTNGVDPRGKDTAMTNLRSINLAISARGLEALRSVDPTLGKRFCPSYRSDS